MASPANLLFLLSDNHARRMSRCYGNPRVHTPNIDALAARGVRFDNAYTASPICCPARAAIATGRYPHTTGYWDNCIVYDGRVRSWMHELRDAGYNVVAFGKLHYRSSDDDNGFTREVVPMHIAGAKGDVSMLLRWSGDEPIHYGHWDLYMTKPGVGDSSEYRDFDRVITDQAVQWIRSVGARSERPWAIFVSYVSPHPPFVVPQRLFDLYAGVDFPLPPLFRPEERPDNPAAVHMRHLLEWHDIHDEARLRIAIRAYHALVTHLDEQIGEVLGALATSSRADDTRVIYSSDHGESVGDHGFFGKGHMYEAAIGVPLIMAGKDLPRGRVVREPVSHVDLYPTICEAAGVTSSASDLDGDSLWRIVDGAARSRPVLSQYHAAAAKDGWFALRKGSLKLIYHPYDAPELYDLDQDPEERNNLLAGGRAPDRLAAMESELRRLCDPHEVDRRAKEDQRKKAEYWGGNESILNLDAFVYSPTPKIAV